MRLLPFGPGAILAEYDTIDEVMAVDGALRACELAGVDEVVPAARTVLVRYHDVDRVALDALLVPGVRGPRPEGPIVEIPVVYDGVDLEEVAAATGRPRSGHRDAFIDRTGGLPRIQPVGHTRPAPGCGAGPRHEQRSPPVRSRLQTSSPACT
jgi:hypothetical protein